jgi:hypothetical protein
MGPRTNIRKGDPNNAYLCDWPADEEAIETGFQPGVAQHDLAVGRDSLTKKRLRLWKREIHARPCLGR